MTVNRIGSSYFGEKTGNTHKSTKTSTGDFRSSLAGSIEKKEEGGREELKVNGKVTDIKNFYDAAAAGCVSGNSVSRAVSQCEPKGISSGDCDRVKVSMEQGCIYKVQINPEMQSVYVEQKTEDGSVKGYEVSIAEVSKKSSDRIEKLAMETWESYHEELSMDEEFEKELLKFYEFTEDRVKNGPPKIQIGASAISEKDWRKLIEKLDEAIRARKAELKERMEKRLLQEKLQKTGEQDGQQKDGIDEDLIQKILEEEK
ncbi:MAG: hypothetical protein HFI34_00755 [Lachnospiraceae bacterium]|nr:hypothetical protein [Lachnospiraceae bacterium]